MDTIAAAPVLGQGMTVAGALMIEHRVIERMIRTLNKATASAGNTGTLTVGLLDAATDFFSAYADRRHHGKEENIFFSELGRKQLAPDQRRMLGELIAEHETARSLVGSLVSLSEVYKATGPAALLRVIDTSQTLCRFYRAHIEKEDRQFFPPAMRYFSGEEQKKMLEQFRDFDAGLPGEDYRSVFERLDRRQYHTKGESHAKSIVRKDQENGGKE